MPPLLEMPVEDLETVAWCEHFWALAEQEKPRVDPITEALTVYAETVTRKLG